MNLTEQTVSANHEISLQDALNASLWKLRVAMGTSTTAPEVEDLIVYVDKAPSTNPTIERKQYVFNLTSPLKYLDTVGDELLQQIKVINNDITMETFVTRKIGMNETGNYILEEPIIEILESVPITLFESVNYVYTNYTNADLTIVYPKDNEENKAFLNSMIYYQQSLDHPKDFSLEDLYFKDSFTKTENNLNLEVNHLRVDCITSNNNKFHLDSEGNLTVNCINTTQGVLNHQDVCDFIYPIGSIYLSVSNTDPATLFGGSWSRITGYYLYAGTGEVVAGSNTSGSTALTISQMPRHTHIQNAHKHAQHNDTWMNRTPIDKYISSTSGFYAQAGRGTYYTSSVTATNQTTGDGEGHTHSITPLRYEVYMWKRIA